jgi:inhibitor of KinA sporulation pathway (predicted exonuclease)
MRYYVVVDLEGTCCDPPDESVAPNARETIEIGAVMIDCAKRKIVSDFQTYVRPVRNPILTDFCTELTTIKQADVDAAPLFPLAFSKFLAWAKCTGFASWGRYDKQQLQRDCKFHKLTYPLGWHVNFASVTKQLLGMTNQRRVLKALGIKRDGTHHRGIDDARTIAQIVLACLERDWKPQ